MAVAVTCVDLLTEQWILTERKGEKEASSERENFLGVKIVNAGTCDEAVAVKIVITGNCDGKVDIRGEREPAISMENRITKHTKGHEGEM